MAIVLALDVYGTIIDTAGVTEALKPLAGERAGAFARQWREKQLEYAFRRALMRNYRDFSVCTGQALDYTSQVFGVPLSSEDKHQLLEVYKRLPAFPDAIAGITALKDLPLKLFAFSNGRADDVAGLLDRARLLSCFDGMVSLSEAQTFKPDPGAYAYFHRHVGLQGGESWLVSSNPFDVIGAISAGMAGVWVKRSAEAVFDPWEIQPTLEVGCLEHLASFFRRRLAAG